MQKIYSSFSLHFLINQKKSGGNCNLASVQKRILLSGPRIQLSIYNRKKRVDFIKKFRKCANSVSGDIPRELINPCAAYLAKAFTPIYNACLLTKYWPDFWKIETIVPIPKTISPRGMDDIHPMTTLWSKMLESYISSLTIQETAQNWKPSHYGERKGSSLDHVVINIWDKILTRLDSNKKAVVLAGIDFSNSFSRCAYQEILNAYAKLGLSDWGIRMHATFLTNRKMRVKIGNVLSDEQEVTGGTVQGSVLVVLDHNAVMEFVDEALDSTDVFKYVDDLTVEVAFLSF